MGTVVVYETTNYLPYYLTYAFLPTELLFFGFSGVENLER